VIKINNRLLTTLTTTAIALLLTSAAHAENLAQRADISTFIDSMVDKHQFQRQQLARLFNQATVYEKIIMAITRPAEAKPWYQYRPIFVTDKRIRGGVEFWDKNKALLEQAEQTFGVPAEIITAIIGVETFYGQHKGGYRVIDSLITLGFEYPKRGAFFRSELEQFLLMTREEDMDPLSVMGSYAGAMGQPQFISSSFRSYAIDFDKDGKRDLWHNTADVIGSVANYFKRHGWVAGEPIVSPAKVSGKQIKSLVEKGIKPHSSVQALQQQGVKPGQRLPQDNQAALIELEQKNGFEYWLGMNNFYVITRYNHSPLYAMAVYQLGQEILKLHTQQAQQAKS
jgi:membrane-bound lytic murein transglycosylase B